MTPHLITLIHYRNYEEKEFSLGKHTFFIGPNGSGKTNVVEALRTLSVTKSYRVAHDYDAIQWGQTYCRVILQTESESFEYVLTQEGSGWRKVIKHNGVGIPLTQVYGLLPTVLFSPETMQLIDGAPNERRRFLDAILSQADPHYIESLVTYRRVLKERHFVLLRLQQGLGQEDELDFWDDQLIQAGEYLISQRQAFITEMNTLLTTIYPQFLGQGSQETLQIDYRATCPPGELAQRLKRSRGYDIKTGTTHQGPHRDELIFLLDNRDITLFASRGELRRSVLAVKLAEADYLKRAKNRVPILLLDDVFSELDEDRRVHFLAAINEYITVVTTTDQSFIDNHPLEGAIIHQLEG